MLIVGEGLRRSHYMYMYDMRYMFGIIEASASEAKAVVQVYEKSHFAKNMAALAKLQS